MAYLVCTQTTTAQTFSTWIILQLYCFKMTHAVGRFWHDVLTLSTWRILPSKARGHTRHFGGGTCDPYAVCDHSKRLADRRGGAGGSQAGQKSHESCDRPRALSGVTGRARIRAAVWLRAHGWKGGQWPQEPVQKCPEPLSLMREHPLGCISQQPNCHMKNSNLYRVLQAQESSHFHGPFPEPGAILWGKQTQVQMCTLVQGQCRPSTHTVLSERLSDHLSSFNDFDCSSLNRVLLQNWLLIKFVRF